MKNSEYQEQEHIVTPKSYLKYGRLNKYPISFFLVCLFFIISEANFTLFFSFVTKYDNGLTKTEFYLFACFSLLSYVSFHFLQNASTCFFTLNCNLKLSENILTNILGAKPILFDSIPSGAVINKYSNDISILD